MRAIHKKKLKEFATRGATLLAVDCKTKALRSFGLSSDDDPATNRRRIESPVRGMISPKRGESWRLG
jgi:hypothetical protein